MFATNLAKEEAPLLRIRFPPIGVGVGVVLVWCWCWCWCCWVLVLVLFVGGFGVGCCGLMVYLVHECERNNARRFNFCNVDIDRISTTNFFT